MRIATCILLLLTGCESTAQEPRNDPPAKKKVAIKPAAKAEPKPIVARGPFDAPPLHDVVKLFDAKSGARLAMPALIDALAAQEVVFFGETHLDETTHRLELAVYEALIEKTGGKVVLAMEMFERDVQTVLDDYLAGKIDEPSFRHRARAWGNYRTGYRALIETAKRNKLPVVASNAPAALRRTVGFGGREALDKLPPEQRGLLPEKLLPNTDAYWERFARVVRGHMGMIAGSSPEQRLTSSQSLWDNTMGDSCARALHAHPGHVVLHVNGGFHSQHREGAVTQLLARRPGTRVAVLEAVAVNDLPGITEFASARADYVAAVDARARGTSEGFHAVTVAPELRYRLLVPKTASDKERAPLVLWLGDDSFRARDGLAFWRTALGDETAFVVVEPPYPAVTDDLYLAGRWFWPETEREDLGTLTSGVARIVAYVLRHYPIDPNRVVLAGEGTGATVIAATHLYGGGLDFPKLAVAPRRHGTLRSMALPGPRETAPSLTVLTRDREWWQKEAEDHKSVGRTTAVVAAPASDWELFVATEDFLRATLGLPPRPAPEGEARVLVLPVDTPRARLWAHGLARGLIGEGRAASVVTQGSGVPLACLGEDGEHTFGPALMKQGQNIPLAAGPFGGTTILYVPKGRSDEQRAAWQALEDEAVLKKRSRFAHIKVVFEGDAEDNLRAALRETKDKGRSTVLVVPAVFCAKGADMRRWADEAKEFDDVLQISWLPGLGGTVRLP